jgi:hypothetical protein
MSEQITPNPEAPEVTPEEVVTPSEIPTETPGTEQTETVQTELDANGQPIDYRAKFIESSKGAHALLEENKKLKSQLVEKDPQQVTPQDLPNRSPETVPNLYPGFEELDPAAQKDLIAYTQVVENRVTSNIHNDPAISFAKDSYNENRWESAFAAATVEFPELSEAKAEFKAKYFDPKNVPENINDILVGMAKMHLFDKAREIGAEEGKKLAERVQLEPPTGGDKTPTAHRSLADWQRMAQENPAEFAKHSQQYNEDVASGKLKE